MQKHQQQQYYGTPTPQYTNSNIHNHSSMNPYYGGPMQPPPHQQAPPPPHPFVMNYPLKNIPYPHAHDVLCGRGGQSNTHPGNTQWRVLVAANKELYISLPKKQKMLLSQSIVNAVRSQNPPGRFLQKDRKTDLWYDVGDKRAQEKTSQALREGAPDIRLKLEQGGDEINSINNKKDSSSKTVTTTQSPSSDSYHEGPTDKASAKQQQQQSPKDQNQQQQTSPKTVHNIYPTDGISLPEEVSSGMQMPPPPSSSSPTHPVPSMAPPILPPPVLPQGPVRERKSTRKLGSNEPLPPPPQRQQQQQQTTSTSNRIHHHPNDHERDVTQPPQKHQQQQQQQYIQHQRTSFPDERRPPPVPPPQENRYYYATHQQQYCIPEHRQFTTKTTTAADEYFPQPSSASSEPIPPPPSGGMEANYEFCSFGSMGLMSEAEQARLMTTLMIDNDNNNNNNGPPPSNHAYSFPTHQTQQQQMKQTQQQPRHAYRRDDFPPPVDGGLEPMGFSIGSAMSLETDVREAAAAAARNFRLEPAGLSIGSMMSISVAGGGTRPRRSSAATPGAVGGGLQDVGTSFGSLSLDPMERKRFIAEAEQEMKLMQENGNLDQAVPTMLTQKKSRGNLLDCSDSESDEGEASAEASAQKSAQWVKLQETLAAQDESIRNVTSSMPPPLFHGNQQGGRFTTGSMLTIPSPDLGRDFSQMSAISVQDDFDYETPVTNNEYVVPTPIQHGGADDGYRNEMPPPQIRKKANDAWEGYG